MKTKPAIAGRLVKSTPLTAFSLVEVVLALGLCSFALVAIMGLFTAGLKTSRESEAEMDAANLASMLIATRSAAPTNDLGKMGTFAITGKVLTGVYTNAYNNGASLTNFIGYDGQITTVDNAAYQISCRAGTNDVTGPDSAQVYIMLSWPPRATPANAAGRYELFTQIRLR